MSEQNKSMKNCAVCGQQIAKNAKVCPNCGGKVKKPIYKRGWFIALAIVVLIAVVANSGGEDSTNTSQSTQTEQKQVEYTAYKVSTLVNDLQNNALSAEEKYSNQYVELTGKLEVIDSNGKYISLSPENGALSFTNVQCYIKNEDQKSKVATLSRGDILTLKGKIKSVGEVFGYSLDINSIN